ncbi:mannose-1-phosphate guanylyltransferase/mannose-6-phosphate isomerase [Microvirga makkahensis]|uniref:mannose-1-phosphate guanylyltransferase n=1 Tax=Microvirga makkahensis TaxID=1128670 RepID=A0A7X3MTL9_9HYPH|nr:mannose-1-phosphate guanylyltransferase/mannose-6-phosphate isomerase [Microvirga makkahensis]MXQ12885.1 mannose-1-phosphate guanylyltransferase/mannose-6-phosphate isomerase [Microvirga makkahensis]
MSGSRDRILPVILCGGSGTRLWPASRASMPKPFVTMLGELSTFQMAAQRVAAPGIFQRPVVISGKGTRFVVADQLAQIGVGADIILEPAQRDTAAAIAVAACHAACHAPDTVVLVAAADHVIDDQAAFVASCEAALEAARRGSIMTLGVLPQYPATGFGYIRPGRPIEGTGAFRVEGFVEKPDPAAAQSYIDQGCLWNSGNFLFRADVMMEELERFQPEVLSAAKESLEAATADPDFIRLGEGAFGQAPKISIDYAVMERTERAGVLPVSFSWTDIGSWGALWDASPRDAAGNALHGNVEVFETRNSLVHGEGILTAVAGLEDVVVVARSDAVLVASRCRSDLVRDLVAAMCARQHPEASEHVRTCRSWGWCQYIGQGSSFRVKRIVVKPGRRLPLQRQHHCGEHWIVVAGTAQVTVNGNVSLVHENEAIHIPAGSVRRLVNPGRIPLEVVEVEVGSCAGEDDGALSTTSTAARASGVKGGIRFWENPEPSSWQAHRSMRNRVQCFARCAKRSGYRSQCPL